MKFVFILIIAIALIILVGFFGCNKKDDVNVLTDEGVVYSEQTKNDVVGITQQAFSGTNIIYVSLIEERDFEGEQKQWIVADLESVDDWGAISDEKKQEIMQGLINTSRLQLDRGFGGVQIVFEGNVLMKGWWSDTEGYVII